jgi:hypothetical protein
MFFDDIMEKKYNGMYRAQVVTVDKTNANGLYTVRVYPFMATLDSQYLPTATSNLTTRYQHIQLVTDDWVWVFFENGDFHYPVIFDLINFKGSYPTPSVGSYGSYDKIQFGNLTIEYDETNKKLVITDPNANEITLDSTGLTIKGGSATLPVTITGGKLVVNGTSTPPGITGPFCALPNCLLTGGPHLGTTVNNT